MVPRAIAKSKSSSRHEAVGLFTFGAFVWGMRSFHSKSWVGPTHDHMSAAMPILSGQSGNREKNAYTFNYPYQGDYGDFRPPGP